MPSRAAMMAPATSPSVMNLIRAPVARTSSTISACRGRSRMHDGHVGRRLALRLRHPAYVLGDGEPDVDDVGRLRAGGQLLHVEDGRRVEHRPARRRPRAPTARCPCRVRVSRVPSIGSTATSHSGPLPSPTRSPLKSIGASSFSPSPMTTTPFMRHGADQLAHRVDRRAVRAVLVAAADPAARRHGGGLGDAHQLEGEVAVRRLDRGRQRSGSRSVRSGRLGHRCALPRRCVAVDRSRRVRATTLRRRDIRRRCGDSDGFPPAGAAVGSSA